MKKVKKTTYFCGCELREVEDGTKYRSNNCRFHIWLLHQVNSTFEHHRSESFLLHWLHSRFHFPKKIQHYRRFDLEELPDDLKKTLDVVGKVSGAILEQMLKDVKAGKISSQANPSEIMTDVFRRARLDKEMEGT